MESALLNSSHDTKIDLTAIRKKQVAWQGLSIQQRMVVLRRFRRLIAQNGLLIAEIVCAGTNRNPAEVVVAEILPMAEACKFLEKRTKTILRTSRLSPLSRPGWLMGVQTSICEIPLDNEAR